VAHSSAGVIHRSKAHAIGIASRSVAKPEGAITLTALAVLLTDLGILRRLIGTVRFAHDFSQIQPEIFRDFAPTFGFSHRDDVVETLTGGGSQQVRDQQFAKTVAEWKIFRLAALRPGRRFGSRSSLKRGFVRRL
jgi:hypothetical protein